MGTGRGRDEEPRSYTDDVEVTTVGDIMATNHSNIIGDIAIESFSNRGSVKKIHPRDWKFWHFNSSETNDTHMRHQTN